MQSELYFDETNVKDIIESGAQFIDELKANYICNQIELRKELVSQEEVLEQAAQTSTFLESYFTTQTPLITYQVQQVTSDTWAEQKKDGPYEIWIGLTDKRFLKPLLGHEIAHIYLYSVGLSSKNKIFHEGFARGVETIVAEHSNFTSKSYMQNYESLERASKGYENLSYYDKGFVALEILKKQYGKNIYKDVFEYLKHT